MVSHLTKMGRCGSVKNTPKRVEIFVMKRRSGVEYDIPVWVLNYIKT